MGKSPASQSKSSNATWGREQGQGGSLTKTVSYSAVRTEVVVHEISADTEFRKVAREKFLVSFPHPNPTSEASLDSSEGVSAVVTYQRKAASISARQRSV